jgi:serine/threonine protein kinase
MHISSFSSLLIGCIIIIHTTSCNTLCIALCKVHRITASTDSALCSAMHRPEMFPLPPRMPIPIPVPAMPACPVIQPYVQLVAPRPRYQLKHGSRSDYETIKPLTAAAHGGCNVGVLLVRNKRNGKTYIEKRVSQKHVDQGRAQRELLAMLQCKGFPNIIRIREYDLNYSQTGYGSLFMQYCELGSLDGMIKQFRARDKYLADEGFLWKVFWDVAIAFCHMWSGRSDYTVRKYAVEGRRVEARDGWNCYFHRDIKPDNLFLTWTDSGGGDKCRYPLVVVGDFGLCSSLGDIEAGRASGTETSGCTPDFMTPEHPKFCARSDVYQLALVVNCLARMSRKPDMSLPQSDNHPLPRTYGSRELQNLLIMCLQRDPKKRPKPIDLPALVWAGYKLWRASRKDDGSVLPRWAFA